MLATVSASALSPWPRWRRWLACLLLEFATWLTPAPVPPTLETYSLEDAYARHRRNVGLMAEITFERDEFDWRADLLAAERKQHQREKVGYLEMASTDPQRAAPGLELMLSRLQLALNALELERRRVRLAQLEDQRRALQAELAVVPERLTAAL